MKQSSTLDQVAATLKMSKESLLESLSFLYPENRPSSKTFHLLDNQLLKEFQVECTGIGNITNEYGEFVQYSFRLNDDWVEYSVLVMAKEFDKKRMPIFTQTDSFLTRFDSHCETQMLFGDQTCDCMHQLKRAMGIIAEKGEGAIVHIKNHEGRGKGIESKLDQLAICATLGIDTVMASKLRAELIEGLNPAEFPTSAVIDTRDFNGCVAILKYFGVPTKVKLILQTNNPNKKRALEENGYTCEFYGIQIPPNELNKHHLNAKKNELDHVMNFSTNGNGQEE